MRSLEIGVFKHELDDHWAKRWGSKGTIRGWWVSKNLRSILTLTFLDSRSLFSICAAEASARSLFKERKMSINLFVPFHVWELHILCYLRRRHWLTVKAYVSISQSQACPALISSFEGFICELSWRWHFVPSPRFVGWRNLQWRHDTHLGET